MNDTGRRRSVVRAGEEEEDRIRDVIVRVVVQALRSRATRCPDLFLNGPLQIAEPRWWVDMANAALADEDLGTWRVWLVQARAVDDPHLGGWRPDIILTVDLVDRALGRGLSHSVSVRTVIETLGPAMRLRIDPHQARQAAAYAPPRDAGGLRQRSGRYYGTFSMMGWDPGCERYGDRSVESPNLEESSRIGPTETSAPPPDYAVAELVALADARGGGRGVLAGDACAVGVHRRAGADPACQRRARVSYRGRSARMSGRAEEGPPHGPVRALGDR